MPTGMEMLGSPSATVMKDVGIGDRVDRERDAVAVSDACTPHPCVMPNIAGARGYEDTSGIRFDMFRLFRTPQLASDPADRPTALSGAILGLSERGLFWSAPLRRSIRGWPTGVLFPSALSSRSRLVRT